MVALFLKGRLVLFFQFGKGVDLIFETSDVENRLFLVFACEDFIRTCPVGNERLLCFDLVNPLFQINRLCLVSE